MKSGLLFLLLVAGPSAGGAPRPAADAGAIAGSFKINNALPEGATLEAALYKTGSREPAATRAVKAEGAEVPYSFAGLGAGRYKVLLVATRDGKAMPLGETAEVELLASAMTRDGIAANAIGADGKLSGTVEVTGAFPPKRMVFVNARRADMTHKSFMPDELNIMSFELNADDVGSGKVAYAFKGLSYGVYRVLLIGYDFQTHKTQTYGELPGEVVIDLDHRDQAGKNFAADLGQAPAN